MIHKRNSQKVFATLGVKILVCFLLLLQLFPPLWIQDVTSLRHFLLAIFDISVLGILLVGLWKNKISISNPIKFKPLLIFLLLFIWMLISMLWAINKVESIAVWNRWFLVFVCACLLGIVLDSNNKIFRLLVVCSMFIALVNVLTCIIGYYHFDLHISQRRNLMLNGGYGNKNIFAVCLLFKLPFLYYALLRYKSVWKIVSSVLIAGVCFCLVILSTRSTFIGLFFHLIILVGYGLLEKFRFKANNKYILYTGLATIFAIGGFFIGNKFIEYNYNKYANRNIQNNYSVAARVQTIEDGNSKGRLLIWKNTVEIIKMNPIWGYGIGNHKLNIMRVEAKKKMNYVVSDHAHNDFLEMQSELGIIGELLYILLYLSMAIVGIKIIIKKNTKQPYRLIALCSLLLLVTYMNDALFNFPNERATPQIYLAISLAIMMFAYLKTQRPNISWISAKYVVGTVGIMMLWFFYVESCHFVSSIVQHQRILCHNSHNKKHIHPSYWVNMAPWLPNIDESTKPIAINNAAMFAMEGDYRTAINMILVDNSNPFYGLKEYRLASYYAHLDMQDSSNYWADKCIEMKPLCYDPVSVKIGNCKKQGDVLGQIKLLENYLVREQKEERAWLSLINAYLQQGDYAMAEQTLQQSLMYKLENNRILSKKSEIEALKQSKKDKIKDK